MTLIEAFGGSGATCVTGAERLLLKPPPSACAGGVSSVRPWMVTVPPPQGVASVAVVEVAAASMAVIAS
ncbi:MAG: hypothetical protein DMF55_06615, partial [Acidobacteria bacterium]